MGMFDYVNYKVPCINCGKELNDFQSKDSECTLATLEPKDVKRFYTSCDDCKTWNEYEVVPETISIISKPRDY